MTDGPALLRAILECPDADMPRLEYADWCDENGNAERAEFIRVQCEMVQLRRAFMPPDDPCTCSREGLPKRRAKTSAGLIELLPESFYDNVYCGACTRIAFVIENLRRRERELWVNNNDHWWSKESIEAVRLSHDTSQNRYGNSVGVVRRGFVDEIHVTSTMLTEDFAHNVWSRHPVRKVVVTDAAVWPSGGNNTYYIGGLDQYPRKYWRRLDGLPSAKAARDALSDVIVAWGRKLAGIGQPRR